MHPTPGGVDGSALESLGCSRRVARIAILYISCPNFFSKSFDRSHREAQPAIDAPFAFMASGYWHRHAEISACRAKDNSAFEALHPPAQTRPRFRSFGARDRESVLAGRGTFGLITLRYGAFNQESRAAVPADQPLWIFTDKANFA
jgi:hypothetical protein